MFRLSGLIDRLGRKPEAMLRSGKRQLLLDISVLSQHDAGTGIQRVVNALLKDLCARTFEDFELRPIAATRSKPFRYFDLEAHDTPGRERRRVVGKKVFPVTGDVFLGLDLSAHILPAHEKTLIAWKRRGVRFHFMVYDLLPCTRPEWFSDAMAVHFGKWVRTIARLADGLLCISGHVRSEVIRWLEESHPKRAQAIAVHHVSLGSDVAVHPAASQSHHALLTRLRAVPSALVVGTIEPRKGHAAVLAAFEILWSQQSGNDFHLVIAGRGGWKTEAFQARLRGHTEQGRRLHWLDEVDDSLLSELYEASTGVIVASYDEGYGLPIIEAARHKKPVMARDIAVFRELASYIALFFEDDEPQSLADGVARFLLLDKDINVLIPQTSWRHSGDIILKRIGIPAT